MGREFDHVSLSLSPGSGEFDQHPRGLINHGGANLDAFKGKDSVFVADWLKSKGLQKEISILYLLPVLLVPLAM